MFPNYTRVAIVYDWIDKWGGVERVLIHLHTLFPTAHFYTSAVDYKTAPWAKRFTVHPSFIQRLPPILRTQRALLLPLLPFAFESFQFDDYDLVISVTSSFAKGIVTKPGTKHLCYLLTPPRYLWSHIQDYIHPVLHILGKPLHDHLKKWDLYASTRPDATISISQTTAERAKKYYGLHTEVVHPPFDSSYWVLVKPKMKKPPIVDVSKPYYLWVGRMEQYKRADLVLDVARTKGSHNFIFAGTGSLARKLMRNSPRNCQFTGSITDDELSYLYTHAEALIMPQNEDFGYISLEAQYHGCPVLALKKGGACETIADGVSGLFFEDQTTASIVSVLERFEQISYNLRRSTALRQKSIEKDFGAQRFDTQFVYQLNQFTRI